MERKDILNITRAAIIDQCDLTITISDFSETLSLYNDLRLDSLHILEILMRLEREFNIEIKDEEFVYLDTLGEIVDYISNKLN